MLLFTVIVCRDTEKIILECMHENLIFNFFLDTFLSPFLSQIFFFERILLSQFFWKDIPIALEESRTCDIPIL